MLNAKITGTIIREMILQNGTQPYSRDDILKICRIYYPNPTPPQIYNIDCIIRSLVDTGILILTHSPDYKEIHYLLNPAFFKAIEGYRISSDLEVYFDENKLSAKQDTQNSTQ